MAEPDPTPVTARLLDRVGACDAAAWDALAGPNPFVRHAFLSALEQSGSVGPNTGWIPAPILIDRPDSAGNSTLAGALPAYLKTHSQGEYVFDHGWADAWARAGGDYYPKLQIAVPFSPVPGPRLLTPDPLIQRQLLRAAETLVDQNGLSSAHASFIAPEQLPAFEAAGWLIRTDRQFHWINRGYADFDAFLASLASRKRKAIRKERAAAQSQVRIEWLDGAALTEEHWDVFWRFYQDTGARKWGRPYLTRAAFSLIGQTMADNLVLMLAHDASGPVAGALHLIGSDRLYGRYWGTTAAISCLHFELCYYQAIELAIARGLAVVEAGAQGSHKLARGYEPVTTFSAHHIADPGFRAAVADFLERERRDSAAETAWLASQSPYRRA